VAVAIAAGLHCSRIDGSPLVYNQPNPYMPDLLICQRDLARRILGLLDARNDLFEAGDDARLRGGDC
jgi:3'-phosphoadenosine 5'-phosphosulfate (PAPS) 3'-phosphatase